MKVKRKLGLNKKCKPERCRRCVEHKCPDCGPTVQRSLWGVRIQYKDQNIFFWNGQCFDGMILIHRWGQNVWMTTLQCGDDQHQRDQEEKGLAM